MVPASTVNAAFTAKVDLLRRRLDKNVRRLKPWAAREDVDCYRVFDRDIPEIPLALDVYGAAVVAHVYEGRHGLPPGLEDALLDGAADALAVPRAKFFSRRRARVVGGTQAVETAPAVERVVVHERAAKFWVELGGRLDVGLFLDHRNLRAAVAAQAHDRRVLNLFAYTGSFGVCAALAGAAYAKNVDLSPVFSAWAHDNAVLNGLREARCEQETTDVFAFLERDSREKYDLIVLDPPTISRSRRAERDLDIQRDHTGLIARCMTHLARHGTLFFSTNFQGFTFAPPTSVSATETTAATVPVDFPHRPPVHRSWKITF